MGVGNRRVGLVTLVLLATSCGAALLLAYKFHLGTAQTLVATLTAGAGLPALYLAWATLSFSRADEALDLSRIADQLAEAVQAQWHAEASVRRLGTPYLVPVSWDAADTSFFDDWDASVRLATSGAGYPQPPPTRSWADGPSELAGRGNELVEVLERVPTRRLIVLGAPGAGKTILMVRLVLDLLTRRKAGEPVPVMVALASWDPVSQDLRRWLTARLTVDYPALAAAAPITAGTQTRAEALLAAGLIMPILDGLDEIPGSLRSLALRESMTHCGPVNLWWLLAERQSSKGRSGPPMVLESRSALQLALNCARWISRR